MGSVGTVYFLTFLVYIAFTYFAVLNVVTGVFCESAIASAAKDNDSLIEQMMDKKAQYEIRLKKLFADVDTDESGVISLDELVQSLQDPKLGIAYESLDLD